MKILLLSCNTGEGHNSAAAAIREQFEACGDTCVTCDALALESKGVSKLISTGHSLLYKHFPDLFEKGYKSEEQKPVKIPDSLLAKAAKRLNVMLCAEAFDAIISTHVFGGLIVSLMKETYGCTIPNYLVATDYTCSPYFNCCDFDRIFIPHPELTAEFLENGIPESKLVTSGIPIRQTYVHIKSREQARSELDLPMHSKIVLAASGSIGCGPLEQVCMELLDRLPPDGFLVVICGHSASTYSKLKVSLDPARCRVVGFTDRMADYMAAADVYLTKAGGISTTEALVAKMKIVLMDAIQGCETHNFAFLTRRRLATGAKEPKHIADLVMDALNHAAPQGDIWFSANSAARIYEEVAGEVRRRSAFQTKTQQILLIDGRASQEALYG